MVVQHNGESNSWLTYPKVRETLVPEEVWNRLQQEVQDRSIAVITNLKGIAQLKGLFQ